MIAAAIVTFRSPKLGEGEWRLFGLDYMMLHQRRIDFAMESLRQHGSIPAWYPREFLGTPFWSNVQGFPLLPTRLALLPTGAESLFTLAVYLSLALSAGFTYLFARRMGQGVVGAAVAGWTWVCGGYFASRLAAGQLGMLETYWALPLVLYVVERIAAAANPRAVALQVLLLGLTCGALAVAAHPQHPVYAVATAAAYILVRCRPWKRAAAAIAAIGLGIASFGFQLVPMAQLIARSTRVLKLGDPGNDIEMPYDRLLSMLSPWRNGAPDFVNRPSGVFDPQGLYGQQLAYFWDTVNYIGVLPLVAVLVLLVFAVWRRRRPNRQTMFVIVAAAIALFLALPVARQVLPASPFIILRSPARLMYFVNFALALSLGAKVHLLLSIRARWRAVAAVVAIGVVGWHVYDLSAHARAYVLPHRGYVQLSPNFDQTVERFVGDGRVGIDKHMDLPINRRIDDIGVFDSILLANVYQALLDMNPRLPSNLNLQEWDGGQMSLRALRVAAVRLLVTTLRRGDMPPAAEHRGVLVYEVPEPSPRVTFLPAWSAQFLGRDQTRALLRDLTFNLRDALILPTSARPGGRGALEPATQPAASPLRQAWRRPRPDRIEITVSAPAPGYVKVVEAFDIGWRATVDGRSVRLLEANNMMMAIPVPQGEHEIVLEYSTPGRNLGIVVSAAGLIGLISLVLALARQEPTP